MDSESKMDTPRSDQSIWSPTILYDNHPHGSGTGLTSTPYWPSSFKKLDESQESSKQDSGYCSATPRSADSGELLFDKCLRCNKSLHHSYAQSTPEYVCGCKKPLVSGSSPNGECMEAIKEVESSPTPKLPSRVRFTKSLELYEEAMDTSFYPAEMEVNHHLSGENHQFSLDLSELGEEKSIDFMEPHVFAASQASSKETPLIVLPLKEAMDIGNFESSSWKGIEEQGCKVVKNTEIVFSPEVFSCDLVSPKIKNESTPTKFKRGTPPQKIKKGSTFQNSAKKVATMNRVLRYFHLNGIETVDFLYQLGQKRSFPNIINRIFSFLSEKDLDAVRIVSKTWNKILQEDKETFNRWKQYSTAMRLRKENFLLEEQETSGLSNRPAFTQLQNILGPASPPRQPSSPPVSPGSARFRFNQKLVKSLKPNERLLACPKCWFNATDRGRSVVECPRSGCRHRFCVWCSIEVVPDLPHECPPLYTPRCISRRNTMHSVGSKSAKQNLRRLLKNN